jgi:hypothetical protein
VFLRTLLFGVVGAITGAVVFPTTLWVGGTPIFEGYIWYWALACPAGFAGMAIGNLICEVSGLYKIDARRDHPKDT